MLSGKKPTTWTGPALPILPAVDALLLEETATFMAFLPIWVPSARRACPGCCCCCCCCCAPSFRCRPCFFFISFLFALAFLLFSSFLFYSLFLVSDLSSCFLSVFVSPSRKRKETEYVLSSHTPPTRLRFHTPPPLAPSHPPSSSPSRCRPLPLTQPIASPGCAAASPRCRASFRFVVSWASMGGLRALLWAEARSRRRFAWPPRSLTPQSFTAPVPARRRFPYLVL